MKRKQEKKLESQILKLVKKSSSKINFKEIGDKLKISTKKDLKILKKKLRNLKERGKLVSINNNYTSINDPQTKTMIGVTPRSLVAPWVDLDFFFDIRVRGTERISVSRAYQTMKSSIIPC